MLLVCMWCSLQDMIGNYKHLYFNLYACMFASCRAVPSAPTLRPTPTCMCLHAFVCMLLHIQVLPAPNTPCASCTQLCRT